MNASLSHPSCLFGPRTFSFIVKQVWSQKSRTNMSQRLLCSLQKHEHKQLITHFKFPPFLLRTPHHTMLRYTKVQLTALVNHLISTKCYFMSVKLGYRYHFVGFVTKENVKFVLFAHPVHQYSSDHMFLDSIISIHLYVVFILKREILPWKTSWPWSSQWPLASCFDPYGYVTSFVRGQRRGAHRLTFFFFFF